MVVAVVSGRSGDGSCRPSVLESDAALTSAQVQRE